jgi:ABC-type polysaccharide/polyol phosphate export permease
VVSDLRELWGYRTLLRDLVARDLKVRYKRSVLGVLWTMLNPLLLMAILAIVFSHVLKVTVEHFAIFLLSALVLWNFFSQATSWSTGCFLSYASLIRKIYVPRSIFVVATVLAGTVNLLISLVPLALIMLVMGHPFTAALGFLPIPIVLTAVFALGVSLALAPLSVMFADIVPMYQILLTAWMYLTPIIYPLSALPEAYRRLLVLNPMTHLVEAFRTPIYQGAIPSSHVLITRPPRAFGYIADRVVDLPALQRPRCLLRLSQTHRAPWSSTCAMSPSVPAAAGARAYLKEYAIQWLRGQSGHRRAGRPLARLPRSSGENRSGSSVVTAPARRRS